METKEINFKVGDLVIISYPHDYEFDAYSSVGKVESIGDFYSQIVLNNDYEGFYTSTINNDMIEKIQIGDCNTEFDTIETIVEEGLIEEYRKLRLHGNKRD